MVYVSMQKRTVSVRTSGMLIRAGLGAFCDDLQISADVAFVLLSKCQISKLP